MRNPKSLYLVTGGAGFSGHWSWATSTGSNIVEQLVGQDERLRILDNLSTGKRENLVPWLDRVELIEGDVRDTEMVRRAMAGHRESTPPREYSRGGLVAGVDHVLHQAASVYEDSPERPSGNMSDRYDEFTDRASVKEER